jgi:hypothetical protein
MIRDELLNPPAIVRPAEDLAALAKAINAAHQQAGEALQAGLEHARRAGQLLAEAKRQCGHGKWTAWLKVRLESLSYREALKALAEPPESEGEEDKPPEPAAGETPAAEVPASERRSRLWDWPSDESRHETMKKWWDIFAVRVLYLDLYGWSPCQIAEWSGMPLDEVEAVLCPDPSARTEADFAEAGVSSAPPDLLARYAATVREKVHRSLWVQFIYVKWLAEDEGREDIRAQAEALSRHHDSTADRLKARTLLAVDWEDEDEEWVVWACAIIDARAALRIDPPYEDFVEMYNVVLGGGYALRGVSMRERHRRSRPRYRPGGPDADPADRLENGEANEG